MEKVGELNISSEHLESQDEHSDTSRQPATTTTTTIIAQMTEEHKNYILKRHKTLDLDPMPSTDPNEPYNWPRWKSRINLFLIAFHALMIGFVAGSPIPAFEAFANDFDVAVLGVAPLFWRPLSERFGRRPMWLISTLLCMVCSIGCACCTTYAQMLVARAFQAFFNAPAGAVGPAVVVELFFAKERGQKLGIWTLMVTLGNPLGPLLMGFVAVRVGWRWIFWIMAVLNGAQFIGYLFFSPETRYIRQEDNRVSATKPTPVQKYLTFGKIPGSQPLLLRDFWLPFTSLAKASVNTTALTHMVIFCFCSVLVCIEIPALLGSKFNLNFEAIGLNFIPLIIGNVIGEIVSGPLSDWWQNRAVKNGVPPLPERRLWLFYPALGFCFAGITVFLVTLDQATEGKWNVRPDIGLALAGLGNQMSTTILFTYAVDKNPTHSGEVGVILVLVRQIWSFIGPFWFPVMFRSIGLRGSAALCCGLMAVFSGFVVAGQHILGSRRTK
ncbi:hypothetical protein V2G26_012690 [Clonostachys chloroleuca]